MKFAALSLRPDNGFSWNLPGPGRGREGPDTVVNALSSCSCQKMVVASRAIAAFGMMVADDRHVARTALARPIAGDRASTQAITACSREFPVTRN
jgi:hypothetical protein